MRDRQVFQQHKLSNGIEVYLYPLDVPFSVARVSLPFGTKHNTGDILGGTAHFLEHAVFHRSRRYPEKESFRTKLQLDGGYFNAWTSPQSTSYELEVPQEMKGWAWEGFLGHIFEPLFEEADIAVERGIITSERVQRERWWPGKNELGRYLTTKWKDTEPFPLSQLFGSDEDLSKMTADYLAECQKRYTMAPAHVLVGGTFDQDKTLTALESIKTEFSTEPPATSLRPLAWSKREYHEHAFRDIAHPIYYWGGLGNDVLDPLTAKAIRFILILLTNSTHGPLYLWLRREKGWAYSLSAGLSISPKDFSWAMDVPVSTLEQVAGLRAELQERVLKAISDEKLVAQEVVRRKNGDVFSYQTLSTILNDAEDDLYDRGRIFSEAEHVALLEACRDTAFLRKIYDTYLSPSVSGEFCALPEKK